MADVTTVQLTEEQIDQIAERAAERALQIVYAEVGKSVLRNDATDKVTGRTAYVDEILFMPVPDVAVRLAGLETGEYHYANNIKTDQYDRMRAMPQVVPSIVKPYGWSTAVLNHKQGLMTDKRLRQAVQAALDMEAIMAAGFGHKDFYRLDPSLLFVEQPQWYSKASGEAYNQKNKAKAQRLLKEAGYAGQPVRWLTTREYEYMYKNALVAKQQMEEVGFKVDLQVVDWATLVQRRNKPELFDIFSTAFTFNTDPAFATAVDCNWPGWWCLDEKNRLQEATLRELDPKKRKLMWERVQVLFYEDVGRIKLGDWFNLDGLRRDVRGFKSTPELHFWNVWLTK
ncbi:MAG: hypothetical protein HY216_09730 [Candidatus Rokubacteria bacterium]|nr:hypothetical protein [Candidatus Rokubacteria bacterium]